jgi:hypothetical protein
MSMFISLCDIVCGVDLETLPTDVRLGRVEDPFNELEFQTTVRVMSCYCHSQANSLQTLTASSS